jgi:hypothetical protein
LKKLQNFYILKFNSERLKKTKYNIDISIDSARINSELVTINSSALLRTLFKYKNTDFSQNKLDGLLKKTKNLKKLENSEKNRAEIKNNLEEIEKILFVEDLINIEFKNKTHYLEILKNHGFYVNGIRFVPFMATAGMIRKNTAMFINNNLRHPIMDTLENGRNESTPVVPAKLGAYFSLYCSSTLPVSFPKFAIIPDKEIETMERVDFVKYKGIDEDDEVTEIDHLLKQNAWDGQGLITPRLAEQWSNELELGYTFSCAIIRAPFLKGLISVFDLEKFSSEIAKKATFLDVYGNEQNIANVDLIISESMFKLWDSYKDTNDYIENCNRNGLGFSIAKVTPEKENSHSCTSYQFLQVLKMKDVDIANLCEPMINWFRDISGGSAENMLLYANGERSFEAKNFEKADTITKALILNPSLARDRYVQSHFIKTIQKRKKESYMGNILINSNYQFMVGDPYYQACHIFGLKRKPLLNRGEHYSEYWLKRGIKKIAAIRSPIVHHSELNILNLKDTKSTRTWYTHIHSGIIYPASGIGLDCAIHGGADFDGDLVCTINNPTIIKGRIPGIPIIYESKKAEKNLVDLRDDKKQVESQLKGHNSKVGFATNVSSSLYALLDEFPKDSREYRAISTRLKIGRVIQGEIIDGVKGLDVPPFREHWIKFKKITEDMTPVEVEKWEFNNRILCKVRPSFFRFLYPHYMSRYNKELKRYNIYTHLILGKSFDEIYQAKTRTPAEKEIVDNYKRHTFFLDNNSVVNKISRYMRANAGLIDKYSTKISKDFDYNIFINKTYPINPVELLEMKNYLREYKAFKRGLRNDLTNSYENLDAFIAYLRKQCLTNLSSNESELVNYAIEATYGDEISMTEFCWRLFPETLLQNIMANSSEEIYLPVKDDGGKIEYLWEHYSMCKFLPEELYENKEHLFV